jgi:hypothetical protein
MITAGAWVDKTATTFQHRTSLGEEPAYGVRYFVLEKGGQKWIIVVRG